MQIWNRRALARQKGRQALYAKRLASKWCQCDYSLSSLLR